MNQSRHPDITPSQSGYSGIILLALLAVVVLTGAARYRLVEFPLERDEGGFAVMGNLILDGIPPYTEAYDYKPPGLYLAYALFIGVFGATPSGIHTGLLLMNIATVLLVFFLAKSWFDPVAGLIAAALYALLSLSPSVLGFAAHATHFVIFWSLAGLVLLGRSGEGRGNFLRLAAGIAFGIATLMKQPGFLIFLFGLTHPFPVSGSSRVPPVSRVRASFEVAAGFLIPLGLVLFWLWSAGAAKEMFFWNVQYTLAVGGGQGLSGVLPKLGRSIAQAAGGFLPLWILAAMCAIPVCVMLFRPHRGARALTGFFLFSAASVLIGYEYRPHYFILLLPAASMLIAGALSMLPRRSGRARYATIGTMLVGALALMGVMGESTYFISGSHDMLSRAIYHPNQFSDAAKVASFIRSRTSEEDRIAVLGSEPEIIFLSGRRSVSPYLFTNFFNEKHSFGARMQEEMGHDLDTGKAAMIVMVNNPFSWGAEIRGDWPVLRKAREVLQREYRLVGTVRLLSPAQSLFRWDEDARADSAALSAQMIIFEKVR